MKKFIYTATIEVEAESEEDSYIEILHKEDAHDIDWEVEELEE